MKDRKKNTETATWSSLTTFFLLRPKKKSGRWSRTPVKNWGNEALTGKKTRWNLRPKVLKENLDMLFWRLTKGSTKIKDVEAFQDMMLWSRKTLILWVPCILGWWRLTGFVREGIAEWRKHKRCTKVVEPCILHCCEGLSWNTLGGSIAQLGEQNLSHMNSRKCLNWCPSLEWFRANQIRTVRNKFAEGGGESVWVADAAANMGL